MKRKFCDTTFSENLPTKSQRMHCHQSAPQGFTPLPLEENASSTPHYNTSVDLRRVIDEFVAIYERLDSTDDPLVKPNYSYTELVYLALLRSPNFCLPINEIYKYIQTKFQFFRRNTREHWRNAVRHSLSKTKCFTKIGVRRGPNSSGTYNRSMFLWTFFPSSIVNFARGDYRSSVDKESGTNTLRWGYYRINAGEFWDRVSLSLDTKMMSFKESLAASPTQAQIFEVQLCILPGTESQYTAPRPSTSPETHPAYRQDSPPSVRTTTSSSTPASVQPTHGGHHIMPTSVSQYHQARAAHSQVTATRSQASPSLSYSSSTSPFFHTSPALPSTTHEYHYIASPEHDSPSFQHQNPTLAQSTPNTACVNKATGTASRSLSWDSSTDILSCAWNAVNSTPCDNSDSDLSSNSECRDSGVSTDTSSSDNSYLHAFIDGRQFHSPPQNVNMFSPSFHPQRYQSNKMGYTARHAHAHAHAHPPSNPRDTFTDVQLLPEASLSSLFDLASSHHQESSVFDFLSQDNSSVKQESDSGYASSFAHDSYLAFAHSLVSNVTPATSSCKYSTPSVTSATSAHGHSYLPECDLAQFDFLQGLDVSTLASIDNLASYSQ